MISFTAWQWWLCHNLLMTLKFRVGTGPILIAKDPLWSSASFGKTKKILIALTVEGTIMNWHGTSGKMLNTIKLDCQTLSLNYEYEGNASLL
ncbi:unnamed protein product [Blepharisma stoltei]|uniref:Uncharacterized protein n=1 Tax=Blepharisma stoltei TaxID=1481888 RepID=A0AAU9KFS3_9CILI|nr:unnamed protein product [Blepharisma stoltei]